MRKTNNYSYFSACKIPINYKLMKKYLLFFLVLCLTSSTNAQIQWPNGKRAAVVLTYDDAISSQWLTAMPQLEKRKLRGTFFLVGNAINSKTAPIWRAAAKRGHELGNHSCLHLCACSTCTGEKNLFDLNNYPEAYMESDLRIMNNMLSTLDGKDIHSYGYPCNQTHLKDSVDYSKDILSWGIVSYARGGKAHYPNAVQSNLDSIKLSTVNCYAYIPQKYVLSDLKKQVDRALKEGGLIVFIFHGVGGNYITIPAAEHAALLDYLVAQKDKLWIDTFSNVMQHVAKLKKEKAASTLK